MKWLAKFMLHWLNFDLVRALNAPVRNSRNIEWIESKISEWELIELKNTRSLT